MLRTFWTVKGGAGVTVVTAALGADLARRGRGPVLVVDLDGDLPAVLGLAEPAGPGVTDWLASDAPADALDRLHVGVAPGLEVLPLGGGRTWPPGRDGELVGALVDHPGEVLVDAGRFRPEEAPAAAERCGRALADAGRSVLVTRPCYLALRRAQRLRLPGAPRVDEALVVAEEGRALGAADVAAVLDLPVAGCVPVHPAVARAVDAGLLARRPPTALRWSLRSLA